MKNLTGKKLRRRNSGILGGLIVLVVLTFALVGLTLAAIKIAHAAHAAAVEERKALRGQ